MLFYRSQRNLDEHKAGVTQLRRPGARTGLANLVLAGDWTDTGLPGTIEGALRSGFRAAEILREKKNR